MDEGNFVQARELWGNRIINEPLKVVLLPIEAIQPVARADPKKAPTIFCNRIYRIVAQTSRVVRVVIVTPELFSFPIEAIQPVAGADPKKPLAIFIKGANIIIRERSWIKRIVGVYLYVVTIVAVKATLRPKPHKPF